MIDPDEFRRVIGHLPAGVAVVTTVRAGGAPAGLTASAVCSVSLDPTMVLACVDVASASHRHLQASGVFAVNVLREERGDTLARRFSAAGGAELKFQGVPYRTATTGAPVLDDALAWLDCRVRAAYPAGDHTIFVGEVEAADAADGRPLLYFQGRFGALAS